MSDDEQTQLETHAPVEGGAQLSHGPGTAAETGPAALAGAAEAVTDPPATLRAHMIADLANFVPAVAFDPSVKHHAPAFPVGQADRFCFVLISADAGPNAGDYANTLAGHQSEVRLIRPVAPPEIDSLVWLRAERRFRVVWRGFPRARATLEPAENLMPSGCAPRPFAYFPSLTTWCGQAGLHSCDAARADGGWSARPARRRGRRNTKGRRKRLTRRKGKRK